jgi:O-antigen ligase
MVRAALIAFLITQFASDAFGIRLSAAPGLSVSNGIVYLAALSLMLRFAIQRDFKLEASGILASFALLSLYAALSLLVAFNFLEYPGYNLLVSIYVFKGRLFDFAVYFAIFFWGTTSKREAFSVLKVLLVLVGLANLATCLNAFGIVHIAAMDDPHDMGRTGGLMGEPNQQGAFAVTFFPALIAMTKASQGIAKLFWLGVAVLSAAGLLVTGSRGALVGIVLAAIVAAYLYRDRLSFPRIAGWVVSGVAILAISLAIVSVQYGNMLYDRLVEQSTFSSGSALSSGRTDLWSTIIAPMINHPLSMITGFGWNSMPLFGIEAVSHNEYLDVWFNLGLVGLVCYCLLFFLPIRHAWHASKLIGPPETNYLVAFVVGFIALSVAIFFVNLYAPWAYLWPYAGLIMRIVAEIEAEQSRAPSSETRVAAVAPFGWRASSRPIRQLGLEARAQHDLQTRPQ